MTSHKSFRFFLDFCRPRVARKFRRMRGSGQDGLRTQIWRHEIELVIKCCLVCISCHICLLYVIPLFSMYMYASDMTVDETLSAFASTWNCRHSGTIVLIARCTSCKCRPPLCCFTASFGDRGPPALTTVPGQDFISRVETRTITRCAITAVMNN